MKETKTLVSVRLSPDTLDWLDRATIAGAETRSAKIEWCIRNCGLTQEYQIAAGEKLQAEISDLVSSYRDLLNNISTMESACYSFGSTVTHVQNLLRQHLDTLKTK